MQLRNLWLNGFRRFDAADVRLEGPVIAIVGRNEAGKSTILEALRLANDDDAIPETALSERGDGATEDVIRLRFRLSPDDQAVAATFADGHRPTWLIVAKRKDGARRYRVEPKVPRRLDARRACAAQVKSAMGDQSVTKAIPRDATGELKTLLPHLDTKAETLPRAAKQLLAGLDQRLNLIDDPNAAVIALHESIKAAQAEEDRTTTAQLGAHLANRVPRFLKFEDSVRNLRSTYDLAKSDSNAALRNLLQAAGTTPSEITRALDKNDGGGLKSVLDRGERNLAEILTADWSQDSEVRVGLQLLDKRTLAITATTNGHAFHGIEDRSDGLRSYIALRAFVANEAREVPPVLLIDEAETHLHYDAQGDLVRMFEQQRDAASVIYTTHSIACLPQDLGRGVRVVTRDPDSAVSEVRNAWTADGAGTAPLLRAMGAATALLSPSRYLVLGEGPSEPAILPTLFRQALGLRSLPFQIVGRTSSASEDELRRLREENAKVAFILDGDRHGDDRAAELFAMGFKRKQVVQLSMGYEVEDLVEPALYSRAFSSHVKAWKNVDLSIDVIRTPGRADQVDETCDAAGIKRQGHLDIVTEVLRLLDEDDEASLRAFDPSAAKQIARVYKALLGALGIDAAEAALFNL